MTDDERHLAVVHADFLEWASRTAQRFDVAIMNPPFTGGQDVNHIRCAWTLLRPGGRLVAICSNSPFIGERRTHRTFRDWLETIGATIDPLPSGTFRESGTNVRACLICAVMP